MRGRLLYCETVAGLLSFTYEYMPCDQHAELRPGAGLDPSPPHCLLSRLVVGMRRNRRRNMLMMKVEILRNAERSASQLVRFLAAVARHRRKRLRLAKGSCPLFVLAAPALLPPSAAVLGLGIRGVGTLGVGTLGVGTLGGRSHAEQCGHRLQILEPRCLLALNRCGQRPQI